jgi:hypothetical protein
LLTDTVNRQTVEMGGLRILLVTLMVALVGCAAQTDAVQPRAVQSQAPPAQVEDQESARVAASSRPAWCQGTVVPRERLAVPAGSTLTDININGDHALEIIARHDCPAGKRCGHSIFAACGDGTYAEIPAQLEADRVETSMQGILIGKVYWRDILAYEFKTLGDNLGEDRVRYRYDGTRYVRHVEQGVAVR